LERVSKKAPGNKLANTVKATLLNANRFALSTWYHDIKNYQPESTGYLDLKSKSKVNTGAVSRPQCPSA
jgi:hypothetical protein